MIAAADTCLEVPLSEAVERHYGPGAHYEPGLGDFQSAFDCRKIKRFFGWTPRYSWRDQG